MRKCVFTYNLLFFFSLLYINSIGAERQTVQLAAVKEFNVKSSIILAYSPLHDNTQDSFARHSESIAPSLIPEHTFAENIFFMYFPGLYKGKIKNISVTKHNQKDYLLHLFPSHYFW